MTIFSVCFWAALTNQLYYSFWSKVIPHILKTYIQQTGLQIQFGCYPKSNPSSKKTNSASKSISWQFPRSKINRQKETLRKILAMIALKSGHSLRQLFSRDPHALLCTYSSKTIYYIAYTYPHSHWYSSRKFEDKYTKKTCTFWVTWTESCLGGVVLV